MINGANNQVLSPDKLAVNDIVFLEANVRRYPKEKGASARNLYDKGWYTSLDMWRIFRMLAAPASAPEVVDSEDEYAGIEMDDD